MDPQPVAPVLLPPLFQNAIQFCVGCVFPPHLDARSSSKASDQHVVHFMARCSLSCRVVIGSALRGGQSAKWLPLSEDWKRSRCSVVGSVCLLLRLTGRRLAGRLLPFETFKGPPLNILKHRRFERVHSCKERPGERGGATASCCSGIGWSRWVHIRPNEPAISMP